MSHQFRKLVNLIELKRFEDAVNRLHPSLQVFYVFFLIRPSDIVSWQWQTRTKAPESYVQ
jgi:hypothetical protein